MRYLFTLLFALSVFVSQAGVFVYTGVYQGKDLYVKNPFSSDGIGFCVFEVLVNGELTTDEVNSSAFAIDLSIFALKEGDPVEVVIRTKEDCEPRVINPEDISPNSTFNLVSLSKVSESTITFTTENEGAPLAFVIEQFKWNKWVSVARLLAKGHGGNDYEVQVPMTSGINRFRVSQEGARGLRVSESFEVSTTLSPVTLLETKVYEVVTFSDVTSYEVFDAFGMLIVRGKGKAIDCAAWKRGEYYLNFDSSFGVVLQKR